MYDEALLSSVISFHHCAFDTLAESQQNTILRHSAPLTAKNGASFGKHRGIFLAWEEFSYFESWALCSPSCEETLSDDLVSAFPRWTSEDQE